MGEKITGAASEISITEEDDDALWAAKNLPVAGAGLKMVTNSAGVGADGLTWPEARQFMSDAGVFMQGCMDAVSGFAKDPIGWLVEKGLSFLLTVVRPLQEMIQFVSGDGPAILNAASNFKSIAMGLEKFAGSYAREAQESLAGWKGDAKNAAQTKIDDFTAGINGTANLAGQIAQVLQTSSMVMTVIEEFIRALLTELITWLIMIWIPALAAAGPTFGGSTAAAGTATGVRAAQTGTRAAGQVSKLQKLLNMLKTLLEKLKTLFAQAKDRFKQVKDAMGPEMARRRARSSLDNMAVQGARGRGTTATPAQRLWGEDGQIGQRVNGSFGDKMADAGKEYLKNQVKKPGNLGAHVNNGSKAASYDDIGEPESTQQTSENLDF